MLNLTAIFIQQITDESFPRTVQQRHVREKAFLGLRFHPDNVDKQQRQIAKEMEEISGLEGDCQTSIGTTSQNVVRAVVQRYEAEMRATGVDVDCLLHGQRGQRGPWEKVYSWLYTHKFPQWRLNWIWQTWQQQAQPNHNPVAE